MDRQNDFWVQGLGLNLEALLRKSNVLLFGSMMTRKAKRLLPSLVLFDESERHEDKEPATAGADTH
jgi:hypothetical protein